MAEPTAVNSQITDAVTQANGRGSGPGTGDANWKSLPDYCQLHSNGHGQRRQRAATGPS